MNPTDFFVFLWSLPYARWHIVLTIIPSLILWGVWGRYLWHYKRTFLLITLGAFVWGLPLDLLSVPVFHVYGFNPIHNTGISFLGLPLGEYLFFLLVPQEAIAVTLLVRKVIYG
jgi:lycopene cyclase domain-containing protein